MSTVEWTNDETVMIESGTDPWLQGPDGTPVDLTQHSPAQQVSDCEGCSHSIIAGVVAPINGDFCIERCDTCETFDSDLIAARVLAAHLDPTYTVWFIPATGVRS